MADQKRKLDDFNKKEFIKRVEAFCLKVKRLQIDNALTLAKRTLELMRELVTMHRHEDALSLVAHIKQVGQHLISTRPQELVIGNMVRRALHVTREAAAELGAQVELAASAAASTEADATRPAIARPVSLLTLLDHSAPPSAHGRGNAPSAPPAATAASPMATAHSASSPPATPRAAAAAAALGPSATAAAGREVSEELSTALSSEHPVTGGAPRPSAQPSRRRGRQWPGKGKVVEVLNELLAELELAEDAIVASATEHIHANEVILTFGLSNTTLKFLQKAAERRRFQVIVAEGAPRFLGLTMARSLAASGVPAAVIPDAAILALMARVNKVLVGAQAVLATGGVVSASGSRLVALAAKHHRVPFIVVTGLFKLSPLFPHDPDVMFSAYRSPASFADAALRSAVLRSDGVEGGGFVEESLMMPCPVVDYIEPELIDLLITDTGGYMPSYIYRLLSEYYSREDYVLSSKILNRMVGH